MIKEKFVYWKDKDMWLGYLEEFPDYQTQGNDLDELKDNLIDIYKDLYSGKIENVKHVGELLIK